MVMCSRDVCKVHVVFELAMLWVCSDGRIFLETYSLIYKQV
jgi:hypothetical protein